MFIRQRYALLSAAVSICAGWMLGCSDDSLSTAMSKKFVPDAPSGVSASAYSGSASGGASVSWTPVTGAMGYRVYRSTSSSGDYAQVGDVSARASSSSGYSYAYTDYNLPSGTGSTYYYKITAYNYSGESSMSAASKGVATRPGAPSGVTASSSSSSSVTVSWGSVTGATGYIVYRGTGSSSDYTSVGNVSSAPYTNSGLSGGTTYYYRVSAYNSAGEGAQSSSYVSVVTIPSAPTGVTASSASATGIALSWNTVTGAANYRIYRGSSAFGDYQYVGTVSSSYTSYTDNGLTLGTTYYYKVTASNSSGESSESSNVSAKPMYGIPVNVNKTGSTDGSITISWSTVSGVDGYNVYRSASTSDYSFEKVGSTSATSYTDSELSSNTTYYYRVSAYGSAGESGRSPYIAAATDMAKPGAPTGVSAEARSSSSIYISWTPVAGAAGYYVQRSGSADGYYTQVGSVTSASSYTDYSLSANTVYYYRVIARNSAGESPPSSSAYAKTEMERPDDTPSDVRATSVSASSVTLSWRSVADATGYYVYRGASYYGDYSRVGNTPSVSYTNNSGLTAGTTYYYQVSAYNSAGEGPRSSAIAVTTAPGAPQNVTAVTAAKSSSITVSWAAITGATGYYVHRATSATGTYTQVASATATSYTDDNGGKGLLSNTVYYYKVSARNADGTGPLSSASNGAVAFKTVSLGSRTWMAENLNITPSAGNSWCYDNDASNCGTYGRLYDWNAATGACPSGWRLPTRQEWNLLVTAAGIDGGADAGTRLKSGNGWNYYGEGSDDLGFSALPGGRYESDFYYYGGEAGHWWTNTAYEGDAGYAYYRGMYYYDGEVVESYESKEYGMSVRCVTGN